MKLNTEEDNNIHINSESRQQINGNKIKNSQEVKNNNGNTVQLVPNAQKKNLKQIRIIQSLPLRTNEIKLLELEQSLLKEERDEINNRYLHQAEIIRTLRKKEQDLKNKTGISEISANIQQYLENRTSNVSELIKSQAVKTTEERLPNIRSEISVSKSNDSTSKANIRLKSLAFQFFYGNNIASIKMCKKRRSQQIINHSVRSLFLSSAV
ncbi:Protein of unknown function [Cotesia congregata]|uniref:Uncharacterized protein n=1 Tax=Cotesia congregata TaxID=51543 RepID=A0A8J2HQT2_COTCN|nr:Protein of unknown function [Cotesia congregata]